MQAANGKQSRKGKNVLHFSIVIDISFTEIPKHVVELPDETFDVSVGRKLTRHEKFQSLVKLLLLRSGQCGTELTYLLNSLDTFCEAFHADATSIGIDEVTVAGSPILTMEPAVLIGLYGPAVIGPTQVAIVATGQSMQTEVGRLSRAREGEGVGALAAAAGVEGYLLTFGLTALQSFPFEQIIVNAYAEIIYAVSALAFKTTPFRGGVCSGRAGRGR